MPKRKPDTVELIIKSIIAETKAAKWSYRRHPQPCHTHHVWMTSRSKPRIEIECTYCDEYNMIDIFTYITIPWRSAPSHFIGCQCCPRSSSDYIRDDEIHESDRTLELNDPVALPKIIKWLNYRIARLMKQLEARVKS